MRQPNRSSPPANPELAFLLRHFLTAASNCTENPQRERVRERETLSCKTHIYITRKGYRTRGLEMGEDLEATVWPRLVHLEDLHLKTIN